VTATSRLLLPPLEHHEAGDLVFSPSSRALLVADGKEARLWRLPKSLEGDPGRIGLDVRLITNMELDRAGAGSVLDAASWRQRQDRR
jgi:hypothetical protein